MSAGGSSNTGKSSGSEKVRDPSAQALANLATSMYNETSPARQGLLSVFQEILSGNGAKLPFINQAVENSRQAGSTATQQTEEELARAGLSGTPFGARTMASQRTQAAQGVSQTRNDLMMQLFNMIPNFVLGQGQTAFSGLSGAAGRNTSTTASGKSSGHEIYGGYGKRG